MALMKRSADAFNKVTKWRGFLAGWQLGTRVKGDPECDAVRDHREATIILRVEVTSIIRILIDKGIITLEELDAITAEEAEALDAAYEMRFPGVKTTNEGLVFDGRAIKTMRGWKP